MKRCENREPTATDVGVQGVPLLSMALAKVRWQGNAASHLMIGEAGGHKARPYMGLVTTRQTQRK